MNLSTIIVALVVALVFAAIVGASVRNRKKGKVACACGSGCSGCPMSESCHH